MILTDFDAEKYERTIRSEGREEGVAQNMVSNVNSIMKKLSISLYEACSLLDVTAEQYGDAVKIVNQNKSVI